MTESATHAADADQRWKSLMAATCFSVRRAKETTVKLNRTCTAASFAARALVFDAVSFAWKSEMPRRSAWPRKIQKEG